MDYHNIKRFRINIDMSIIDSYQKFSAHEITLSGLINQLLADYFINKEISQHLKEKYKNE